MYEEEKTCQNVKGIETLFNSHTLLYITHQDISLSFPLPYDLLLPSTLTYDDS